MRTIQTQAKVSAANWKLTTEPTNIPPGTYSLTLVIHEQPPNTEPPQSEQETAELIRGHIMPTFAELLTTYMRRIRASANNVAKEISNTRETVNKWRHNNSMPSKKSCSRIRNCAKFLRLTEQETNLFLKAAGCSEVYVDLPEAIFKKYIQALFVKLSKLNPPVMLLLTQTGWGEPPLRDALLVQAKNLYLPENVLHIQPPYSLSADANEYFSDLGEQCGFCDVENEYAFGRKLKKRLKENPADLFLLVSRLEQGVPSLRTELARMLRSLSDCYSHLHVILCGGEALENLKYQHGSSSLLNNAVDERWPELGRDEVYAWRDARFKGLPLDDALVDELLTISGGHPQLLNECLTLKKELPNLPLEDYPERLSQSQYARQAFTRLTQDDSLRQKVYELLQKKDLDNFTPFIGDNLLRKLYWENVLKVCETNRLCWRCEALRIAGQQILGQQP